MPYRTKSQSAASGKGLNKYVCFGAALLMLATLVWVWWKSARGSSEFRVLGSGLSNAPSLPRQMPLPTKSAVTNGRVDFASGHGFTGERNRLSAQLAPVSGQPMAKAELPSASGLPPSVERVLRAQLALVREGISPGSLDGVLGSQTRAALRAYYQKKAIPPCNDSNAIAQIELSQPLLTEYLLTSNDLARLLPLGKTWLSKSQQERLDYETALELVAEKSQAHPNLIRKLNPGIDWSNLVAGVTIRVPTAKFPPADRKAAFLKILLGDRVLEAFDENTNLLAHFPCSIAQRVEKRPVGELRVAVLAPNPNYTFDPDVFPESAEARELGRKLVLPPGPNNPVGAVWIGLDKPGYGIHGTPRPEDVGRTESHGCFRLANWNAEYLLQLVSVGTPVLVEP